MPMPASSIACEIIYLVASRPEPDPVRVKDLHLMLDYSEARVSEVLRSLVADDWVLSVRSNADRRTKCLHASTKTKQMLGALKFTVAVENDPQA